jgi:alpha-tubulin suppressor-like RCC1 family protein
LKEENGMERNVKDGETIASAKISICSFVLSLFSTLGAGGNYIPVPTETKWILTLVSIGLLAGSLILKREIREGEASIRVLDILGNICIGATVLILFSAFCNNIFPESCAKPDLATQQQTPTATTVPELTREDAEGKIAAGEDFTLLLQSDGKVACIGDAKGIDTSGWSDIVQIAAYNDHAIGLCESGHVVTTGGAPGEYDAGDWWGIKQVAACAGGVIGVTPRGAVWFAGTEGNALMACTYWENIDRILGGEKHIVALAKNGEVLALGENRYGALNTEDFSGVIAGAAANDSTFVVFSDGTAAQAGRDWSGEDKVSGWSQLVAIAGGMLHTVGLRDDGTVVCSGNDEDGQCDVKEWKDVVAICAGQRHTVGLCADGSLVATGLDASGQRDVSGVNYWVEN